MQKMRSVKPAVRPVAVAVGLFFGIAIAVPAMAIQSAPTGTVVGHAPTLTRDAAGEISVSDENHNGIIDIDDVIAVNEKKLTYHDDDGDLKYRNDYIWSVNGVETHSDKPTYTIKAADLGQKIKLSVEALTDSAVTDPAVSAPVVARFVANPKLGISLAEEIEVAKSGAVKAVVITGLTNGAPVVGQVLTAEVTLADGSKVTTGGTSKLTYQWQIETTIGSGQYSDIGGASGKADSYTPVKENQRKHIRLDVTPKTP